jgi:methyl-accepting chemotaxis protein
MVAMTIDQEILEAQERIRGQAERLRWLIALRWVGLGGIAVMGLLTQFAGYARWLFYGWVLAPVAFGYNALFAFWLRRVERAPWPLLQIERSLRWQGYLQALCDVVALNLLVYINGGVECPTVFMPLLAVVLSGLLLPRSGVFLQANAGAAFLAAISLAEYYGWIPHVPWLRRSFDLYRDPRAILGVVLAMTTALNLVAYLMSSLGQRLNRAEARTRRLLGQLRRQVGQAAKRLASETVSIQSAAAEVSQVAGQIAATVQQIAQGAGQQATQLDHLSDSLEELTAAGRRVAEGTLATHQASAQTVASAERGRLATREATLRMDEISSVFVQAEEAMAALARHSEEIAEVAAAIDQFAERTDLLALNAEIEAARAGEHGLGFAVVAGEVKKLAAASSASAERVAAMVAQVQAEIAGIVRSAQAGSTRVRDGQQAITTLQEVLDGMTAVIAHTDELAATMESLSQQQREAHQEIMHAAGEIASAAEETAAGAEETAAAVEQQTTSFGDFSRAAQNLAGLAAQLDQAVAGLTGENDLSSRPPSLAGKGE